MVQLVHRLFTVHVTASMVQLNVKANMCTNYMFVLLFHQFCMDNITVCTVHTLQVLETYKKMRIFPHNAQDEDAIVVNYITMQSTYKKVTNTVEPLYKGHIGTS